MRESERASERERERETERGGGRERERERERERKREIVCVSVYVPANSAAFTVKLALGNIVIIKTAQLTTFAYMCVCVCVCVYVCVCVCACVSVCMRTDLCVCAGLFYSHVGLCGTCLFHIYARAYTDANISFMYEVVTIRMRWKLGRVPKMLGMF